MVALARYLLDGTLKKWNDERGFGFIVPNRGGEEVFVHISSFPPGGSRPRRDEPVTFEVETNRQGKKCAIKILRPVRAPAARLSPVAPGDSHHTRSFLAGLGSVLLIGVVGAYGYVEYRRAPEVHQPTHELRSFNGATVPRPHPVESDKRCDGRTRCPQMTSCAEATFFLNNCPGVEMDGNNDGVPCERQWCGK